MGNVVPLRTKDISPAIVIQTLQEDIDTIEDMFVVAITQNGPVVYASGNLMLLSFAALVLQDMALKELNGDIENADPDDSPAG